MMTSSFAYPYNTHTVTLPDNCEVAYIDEGKGSRTLLFIHGLANYAMVWQKNIEILKAGYRCIAIDLPGNGFSDRNEHSFSMSFFADVVYNFIEQLELKNVVLVGHSMGGQIALTTLIKHKHCAQSMVLCAPAGFERFSALDKTMYYATIHMFDFLSSEEQNLRKTIESSFFKHHAQGDSIISDLVVLMKTYKSGYYKKMVEACIKSMLEDAVIDKIKDIKERTLVLFGERDAFIPNRLIHHMSTEKLAVEVAKLMHEATLHIINDSGHFVQWEKADEVNKFIVYFLEKGQ